MAKHSGAQAVGVVSLEGEIILAHLANPELRPPVEPLGAGEDDDLARQLEDILCRPKQLCCDRYVRSAGSWVRTGHSISVMVREVIRNPVWSRCVIESLSARNQWIPPQPADDFGPGQALAGAPTPAGTYQPDFSCETDYRSDGHAEKRQRAVERVVAGFKGAPARHDLGRAGHQRRSEARRSRRDAPTCRGRGLPASPSRSQAAPCRPSATSQTFPWA